MEHVEIFAANDVPEWKQVPVLLNAIGGYTYGVLRSLLAPDNPMDKTLLEIAMRRRDCFEPKPLVIAEHFHFNKRNQEPGESIADYIAEMRCLAAWCRFPLDHLEKHCGIASCVGCAARAHRKAYLPRQISASLRQ